MNPNGNKSAYLSPTNQPMFSASKDATYMISRNRGPKPQYSEPTFTFQDDSNTNH